MATTSRISATVLETGESAESAVISNKKTMTLTATCTKRGEQALSLRVFVRDENDRPVGGQMRFDASGSHRMTVDRIPGDVTIFAECMSGEATIAVVEEVGLVDASIETADLADDAVTAAKLADGAIDAAAKIADGAVATAKLAAGAVTPPKMAFTGLKMGHFEGVAAAGPCTLVGAAVGDRVVGGFLSGDSSDNLTKGEGAVTTTAAFAALFEAVITVADQIQQASASNLSDNKYTVLLAPAAA